MAAGFWPVSGFGCQVSAQPLAVEVYPPQEGGRINRRRNFFGIWKKFKNFVGAASSRD